MESVVPALGEDLTKPDGMEIPVQHCIGANIPGLCSFAEACLLRSLTLVHVTLVTWTSVAILRLHQ